MSKIGIPAPIKGLSTEGRKIWKELAPAVFQEDLLQAPDYATFGVLCDTLADYRRLRNKVIKDGSTISKEHYTGANPDAKLRDEARKQFLVYAKECGMTYAARHALRLDKIKADTKEEKLAPKTKKAANVALFAKG